MFVCLCNGFTERQVRACLDQGAQSVAAVYRCLGAPQCGKCIGHVREMVGTAPDRQRQRGTSTGSLMPVAVAAAGS